MKRFLAPRPPASALVLAALALAAPLAAGFASTEVFLPAVGRIAGQGGAQFYTTVWATNLTGVAQSLTFRFLRQGQANASPASFTDTLAPGQTKVYENLVESKLGLSSALGAARITSTGEIFVAERIYDQAPGADIGNTVGLFFAGVPKAFSISPGQSASIQGINQGGAENFRYNFALVETGGGSPTVNIQLLDGNGALLGQKAYGMLPYEQLQPNVAEVFPGVATANARITATVTGGTGSVLLAGAQLANVSQDSSGFEMSFRDELLGSGGTAGVTSLNGLAGALTIAHGANTTVNVNGSTITIDAASGSGTGLTAVAHDNSLAGSGTVSVPLAIANGQVVRSVNGLHDAVTLAAGSNVSITPSGNTLTLAASGGTVVHNATLTGNGTGGSPLGITLPLALHVDNGAIGSVTSSHGQLSIQSGAGNTLLVTSGDGPAIDVGAGTVGIEIDSNATGILVNSGGAGVDSTGNPGILGKGYGSADGVDGSSTATGRSGVYGVNSVSGGFGVYGRSTNSGGVAVAGSGDNGGKAAHFYAGDVYIDNNLHVTKQIFAGTKDFQIDSPLDPANRYLVHTSIESSEMLNLYSGNARLDARGEATVAVPSWMEAENGDFRYQLTAIGAPSRDLYVAEEIRNGRFKIAGGLAGAKVSWLVTGVRQDAWARTHPLEVDVAKPPAERGFYLHPEAFGLPPEKQVNRAPESEPVKRGPEPGTER